MSDYAGDRFHRKLDAALGRVGECTGAADCRVAIHVHGCFADLDGFSCDEPEEH